MHLNIILLLNMGLASGKMEPFIVGGNYTKIKRFPHSTYLLVDCVTPFMCGGSILTGHFVLTAGHCLYECNQQLGHRIEIKFGHSKISKMKTLLVSKFLVHEQYNEYEIANDIALLYTRTSLPLGEVMKRVAILSRYPTLATGGYVTGWGVINSRGETATKMKYIYQEVQNHEICMESMILPPGSFCAGSNNKKQHPDQGDSGGAFIVYSYIQIGLVSFKHVNHNLVAYTNVTYFYSWIQSNAMTLTCDHY